MPMSGDTSDNRPIGVDELACLFSPFLQDHPVEPVALAVSGGSDSTALMVLFVDWLRQEDGDPGRHTVLTVDHRLRPESAAEAREVADRAAALGFRHATLVWEGEKPRTGLQAAARAERYRLMGDYASAHAIGTLFTAHTRDDQAETLLMRLARGSGIDGLAGIPPWVHVQSGSRGALRVARPLLDVAKARLVATLEERRIDWSEDPSNESPAFERSRLRAARPELDRLGLTRNKLVLSVRRLQRARAALDAVTDTYCAEGEGIVHTDRSGFFRIDRERLGQAPEEIFLRVIGRCIAAAGGSAEPVSLAKLEPIVTALRDRGRQDPAGWTLARAHVTVDGQTIQIEREPGRQPLPVLTVAGGTSALWDGRFAIDIAEGFEGNLDVRALGTAGLVEVERAGIVCKRTRPLRLVPSFWRGDALLAAPTLGLWARTELAGLISANFVGLRYNSRATGAASYDECGAPLK